MTTIDVPEVARDLHASALVWDNHGCLPMNLARNRDYLPQLARYTAAGVDMVSVNIGYGEMDRAQHFDLAQQMRAWIAECPDIVMAGTVRDIREAKTAGKLAVGFDIEGAAVIASHEDLATFHALGVRWISLAYNLNNQYAGGCHDEDGGLSVDGRQLIAQMEELGIAVCCSHTGYRSLRDTLAVATKPVILSHSNPRALRDHPRNVPDALLRGVAATGGVIGVNGLQLFLGDRHDTAVLVQHIQHLIDVVGVDHVGLGLDHVFDLDEIDDEKGAMTSTFPEGMGYEDPVWCYNIDHIPEVTAALLHAGLSDGAVRKILGGNWLRVAEEIWSNAPVTSEPAL